MVPPSFGTRGSQVQILPLRPAQPKHNLCLPQGPPQVDGRTQNNTTTISEKEQIRTISTASRLIFSADPKNHLPLLALFSSQARVPV